MINMEAEEESLVRSASVAAKELRRKASQAAIELDHLANGGSEYDAEAAKKLLNSAVLNAGMLVNDATSAAKKLLASAAKLAASHKDSLMMKVVAKSSEFDFLYAEAAELIEARKLFLLSQAEFAAADLKRGAIEDALSLADIAAHVPYAIGEDAKKLVNDAATSAKALIQSAVKDAELLLSDAVETAMSLLLRDQEVEEEMLKLRKLAAIASLAGGIAHDFNNILTGVFGNLEMAKLHFPPAHVAYQYILAADQSMERAATLTRQLLTFAKGGDPLFEVIDIRSIIHESITLSLSVSSVKTILLLEDDLWMIAADRGLLAQVMNNLIINADQAMTEGGTLTIEAMNSDELADDYIPHTSGRFVCIKISDDGRGISKARQKTIFDPYFTTKEAGSGLGLATALSIVTKHNGRIIVASDVG
jgi:signal transduction histidine kinase